MNSAYVEYYNFSDIQASTKNTHPLMSDGSVAMTCKVLRCDSRHISDICAVSRGRRVRFAPNVLDVIERRVTGTNLAFKHLLVGLSEVLRQEGVDDRVD